MTDDHFTALEAALEAVDRAIKHCQMPAISLDYTCNVIKAVLLVAKVSLLVVLTDDMYENTEKGVNKITDALVFQERDK